MIDQCKWVTCTRLAERDQVCRRCRERTLNAGRRAATGVVDRTRVRQAVAHYGRPETPAGDRLDDLLWLLENGEDPERAARRCGWTRTSARDVARRHGRHDVAELMLAEAVYA